MPNVAGVEYPYTPEGIAAAQQAERQIGKMGPISGQSALQNALGNVAFGPLTSPGFLGRLSPQPTASGLSGSLQDMLQERAFQELLQQRQSQAAGIADQYQPTGMRQNWQTDQFGNVMTNQFGAPATYGSSPSNPNWGQTQNFGQLVGRAVGGVPGQMGGLKQTQSPGVMFGQNPWQRPITQTPRGRTTNIGQTPTPRGQTIRTTDPGAGYGQSPSGPTAQMPRQPANYGQSPSNPNWKPPTP